MQHQRVSAMSLSWGLLIPILLLFFANASRAECVCSGDVCNCNGLDYIGLADVLSDDICELGAPTKLVLEGLPNAHLDPIAKQSPKGQKCAGWRNIESLEIRHSDIQNLSSTLFEGLPNIRVLNVSHNSQLKMYQDDLFRPLGRTLTELIATDNRVHSLRRRVFSGLKILQKLDLSHNVIGYVESGVFAHECCELLTELSLESNILLELENDTFVGLSRLQTLNLRNNPLQTLSTNVFTPFQSTLTHLWMSHNESSEVGGLQSLPNGLFTQMSRLEELEIVEMKVCNLTTQSFFGLRSLQRLSLRGNCVTMLPKGCFTSMPSLVDLDLSHNGLLCIPDNSAEHYPKLRRLDLSKNGITHLTKQSLSGIAGSTPTEAFPHFVINISSNPIERIEPDAFCGLGGPVELIVSSRSAEQPKWASMDGWPDNPFALVGENSVIRGLSGESEVVEGRPDTSAFCGPEAQLFINKITASSLYASTKFSAEDIDASRKSNCPYLMPDHLSRWQLEKLGVPGFSKGGLKNGEGSSALEEGSRIYLLIIVAVCIIFLLAALTIIICYRAWSGRASQKLAGGDLEANGMNGEPGVGTVESSEKHELLEHPNNGRVHSSGTEAFVSPRPELEPVGEAGEAVVNGGDGVPTRSIRPNSDPIGPDCEEVEQVTAFGIV